LDNVEGTVVARATVFGDDKWYYAVVRSVGQNWATAQTGMANVEYIKELSIRTKVWWVDEIEISSSSLYLALIQIRKEIGL
jgi:hypothetical protein